MPGFEIVLEYSIEGQPESSAIVILLERVLSLSHEPQPDQRLASGFLNTQCGVGADCPSNGATLETLLKAERLGAAGRHSNEEALELGVA